MKKILSILLTLAFVLSTSTAAFAEESGASDENIALGISSLEEDEVPEMVFQPLTEVDLGELMKGYNTSFNPPSELSIDTLASGTELLTTTTFGTERSATQSWTGTLAKQGDFTYALAELAPNQIVNATLECPKNSNLNYDLFIYEMDASGTLGNMLSASTTDTYINYGSLKTVDEGVAYINKSSATKDYAIIVSATIGGSTTDTFKLTVSVDVQGNYDAAEPNDSPYNAYSVPFGSAVNGPTLHVVNDQDWYVMNVNDFTHSAVVLEAATSNGKYEVDLYTVDGNKLILERIRSDNAYSVDPGVYFIQVYANEAAFVPQSYVLNVGAMRYSNEGFTDISGEIPPFSPSGAVSLPASSTVQVNLYLRQGCERLVFGVTFFDGAVTSNEHILSFTGKPIFFQTDASLLLRNEVDIWFYNDTKYSTFVDATVVTRYRPNYS